MSRLLFFAVLLFFSVLSLARLSSDACSITKEKRRRCKPAGEATSAGSKRAGVGEVRRSGDFSYEESTVVEEGK